MLYNPGHWHQFYVAEFSILLDCDSYTSDDLALCKYKYSSELESDFLRSESEFENSSPETESEYLSRNRVRISLLRIILSSNNPLFRVSLPSAVPQGKSLSSLIRSSILNSTSPPISLQTLTVQVVAGQRSTSTVRSQMR